MPFTDAADLTPEPTAIPTNPPTYSPPKNGDVAAVAVTVGVVGVIMFALITWLVLRLRGKPSPEAGFSTSSAKRGSTMTERLRPSFGSAAPSEASSKFGFIRKPLRLVHRRDDGSWDFSDPDPFKESPSTLSPSSVPKHRPAPLSTPTSPSPRTTPKRSSTYKDEYGPRTPSTPGTPASFDFVEPPPPAYCRDGASWPLYQPKDLP